MSSETDSESKPFLGVDDEHGTHGQNNTVTEKYGSHVLSRRRLLIALASIINVLLICLNVFLLHRNLSYWRGAAAAHGPDHTLDDQAFSPARTALQYTIEDPDPNKSPFIGNPRPELDQAWSNLLRSSKIRITDGEMMRMNKTSIALQDGSGYIGYLESIHMLHCVKRIYQFQHQDHYPELQDTDAFTPGHWDHCLEVLRKGIMCNADVTVNTYFWKPNGEIKGFREGPRKCTDWNRVQDWLDERELPFGSKEDFLASLVSNDEEGNAESKDEDYNIHP